jgi:hypothetical protein
LAPPREAAALREAARAARVLPSMPITPDDFTVRVAHSNDGEGASIRRLAQLHGTPAPEGLVAIAEVGGQPVAAADFAGGRTVVDPERSTPEILALLHVHRLALRAIATVWGV